MGDGELHKGHRQRMLKRFMTSGISSLEDHEKLEMILFGIYTRCNTNDISHRLIAKFGSLEKVLETAPTLLEKVEGVGEKAAQMIFFYGEFFRTMNVRKPKNIKLDSAAAIIEYCRKLYPSSISKEIGYALYLDGKYNLIWQTELGKGTVTSVNIDTRLLIQEAINSGCKNVILVHNHPSGTKLISNADINTTREAAHLLKSVGPLLVDHIIICGDTGHSLRASEMLKDVWN